MKRLTHMTLATLAAGGVAIGSGAWAQGTLIGTEALDDRLEDIEEAAQEDIDRAEDRARFGPEQFAPGWSGSVALTYSGATGNTDTQDFGLAGRLRYTQGNWAHSFGFGAEFSEDNDVKNEENMFVVYDANYFINDSFYVFGLGRAEWDDFAPLRRDGFIGFGPGYRIVNTDQMAWRVQAGPGIRYTEDALGNSETEGAVMASSRFFYRFGDRTFLTNDTDILDSGVGTLVNNDLGVNFGVTDTLATRISYRTEWNSDPVPGTESTDNTLGLSLVYSF